MTAIIGVKGGWHGLSGFSTRPAATVPLHSNRIFIELFIKTNNCLYCCMHSDNDVLQQGPVRCMQPEGSRCIGTRQKKKSPKIPAMAIVAYYS